MGSVAEKDCKDSRNCKNQGRKGPGSTPELLPGTLFPRRRHAGEPGLSFGVVWTAVEDVAIGPAGGFEIPSALMDFPERKSVIDVGRLQVNRLGQAVHRHVKPGGVLRLGLAEQRPVLGPRIGAHRLAQQLDREVIVLLVEQPTRPHVQLFRPLTRLDDALFDWPFDFHRGNPIVVAAPIRVRQHQVGFRGPFEEQLERRFPTAQIEILGMHRVDPPGQALIGGVDFGFTGVGGNFEQLVVGQPANHREQFPEPSTVFFASEDERLAGQVGRHAVREAPHHPAAGERVVHLRPDCNIRKSREKSARPAPDSTRPLDHQAMVNLGGGLERLDPELFPQLGGEPLVLSAYQISPAESAVEAQDFDMKTLFEGIFD